MGMSSWATDAQQALSAARPRLDGVLSVYLFGSALHAPDPRDLDLLVVYDPTQVHPRDAGRLRDAVFRALSDSTDRPLDVLLLTADEALVTGFAERELADLLFEGLLD